MPRSTVIHHIIDFANNTNNVTCHAVFVMFSNWAHERCRFNSYARCFFNLFCFALLFFSYFFVYNNFVCLYMFAFLVFFYNKLKMFGMFIAYEFHSSARLATLMYFSNNAEEAN